MSRSTPAYIMMAPFLLLFAVFILGPLGYSVYISFYGERMGNKFFIGFTNYVTAFHDSSFWASMDRVLYYGVVQVTSMIVLALLLSLILDSPAARFKTLFRLLYFLPYAVPGVVATIMWGFLYSPNMDSTILNFLGGGAAHPFNPTNSGTLLYAIINIVLWEIVGYNMTLYYAALTGIPLELYDAAKIDGCGEIRLAVSIKLPMLRPMIIMTVVLSIIGALQLFNEPFFLSQIVPISLQYTPNSTIYYNAFTFGNIPYAATLSMILGLISIIASVSFMIITRLMGSSAPRGDKKSSPNRMVNSRPIQVGGGQQ